MTREKAITTLKKMHDTFDEIHESTNGEIGYEQMTAIDMAIEALMHDRKNMNKTEAAEILQKYVFDDEECIARDMKDYNEALKMAIEALTEPNIVRCKECQWCLKDHEDTWGNIDEYWCHNWGSPTDDCGYCHEAERREL